MEFKKQNRLNDRRLRPNVLQRGTPTPLNPAPQPTAPAGKTDVTQPAAKDASRPKTAVVSRIRRLLLTKKAIIALTVIVCLVAGLLIRNAGDDKTESTVMKPNYHTTLPKGKSISKLGGWRRVSPPGKDPVFAYADTIGGVPISVSQQPLPESFKGDTDGQVAELARKFNATDKIDAGNTKIYIGTSAKGPQSVILTKNNVLILIKSQKKIKDASWAKYAASLD